jgi:hypothetical protein
LPTPKNEAFPSFAAFFRKRIMSNTHTLDTGKRRVGIEAIETAEQITISLTMSAYGIMGDEGQIERLSLEALAPYKADARRIVFLTGRSVNLVSYSKGGWLFKRIGKQRKPVPTFGNRW